MQIGDNVKVIKGGMAGERGTIVNKGEGYGCGEGRYALYFVKIGTGKYATVYQFRADQIITIGIVK